MIGETLSHYEIVDKLGEGGMGAVYRAEDTELKREVALKVLPEEMASDPEGLERFKREAQSIAALNHPNIVAIHSVEQVGDVHFLTMEFIDGESLDRVLPSSGFEPARLLPIASQIADALAAAHDRGITHRDLKPANVMVSNEDRVKVLDFGLAKLAEAAKPGDEATQLLTQEGMILGTVPYMSPEQVQGQPVDHRSDIFSLGILLYEMATGRRPFSGDNPASVASAVLKDQPPLVTELKAALPNHLGRIVRRCLEKLPHKRYQSARVLQPELEGLERELAASPPSTAAEAPISAAARPSRPKWLVLGVAALVLAVITVAWLARPFSRRGAAPELLPRSLSQVTDFVGSEAFPSLSPDGKQIVYAATRDGVTDIHLLRIGGENPINLTRGSGAIDTQPAFSPDGEWIAFRSERQGGGLFVMGATGESVRRLTDFGYHPRWSPDGSQVAFCSDSIAEPSIRTTRGAVWIVEVDSGETRQITDDDASQPVWSPDGRRLAFWGLVPGSGQRDLWTIAIDGTDLVRLTDDTYLDWHPIWSPAGRHIYFASDRGGSRDLWRLPVDPASGKATGAPEPLTVGATRVDHPILAADGGRLAFVSQFRRSRLERMNFDPVAERITSAGETVVESIASLNLARLSGDGGRLLYWAVKTGDALFIEDVDGRERLVLMRDEFRNRTPSWCDRDRTVLFSSDRSGTYEIWSIGTDGSGLRQLTEGSSRPGGAMVPICADGTETLYYTVMGERTAVARFANGEISARQSLPEFPGDGHVVLWDLSPDQTKLGGSVWREGSTTAAVVYDIASHRYRLAEFESSVPLGSAVNRWLSDSRRLVLTLDGSLKILDTETMELRTVEGGPSVPLQLADISSDDRQILATWTFANDDIWMLDLE